MKAIIQRVKEASVKVDGELIASIDVGLLILLGVADGDEKEDLDYLVKKISGLRIFPDEKASMNSNISQVGGQVLSISQFTLLANTKKGNRPSFIGAAAPDQAKEMYLKFNKELGEVLGLTVKEGIFGADMQVSLINDGPVSIILDSKNR